MGKAWMAAVTAVAVALAAATLAPPGFGQARGNTMIVTFKDDVSTLDPAIGYDWQNWSIIKSIFDGLMDYEPGTTKLVPHLAESYTISADGKTYTFRLRRGVKFHNGREVTAQDFKYSLERVLNPKTQSPGAGFFGGIAGAAAFSEGKAAEVSGIRVVDRYTLTITLDKPNAAFLHTMALNFSHVVPREEVEKAGADFGHKPVGTGAFRVKEWVLGQRLVLVRNRDYFLRGRPYLDEIVFQVGVEPNVAFLKLQRGEVDVLGDGIPPAEFVKVMNNPTLRRLVAVGDQLHTGYVTLNTQVSPLTDVRVRRALNMAVDKARIVRIINNRAVPATQVLPPLMPGYDRSYTGYPFDRAQAKKLLAEAGYPNGFSTVLYANNTDPNPRIAQAIQQDLAAIGVRVELKTLAQSTVIEAGGQKGQAPMIWSGGMAWIADYPDPNNFYWPILSCAALAPGTWNWAWYCNQQVEKQVEQADAMVQPAQAAAREQRFRQIYRTIMGDAPWIPIFHEKRYTMHSARMGGPEVLWVDPIHIPVHYDEVRVVR
ncbi:MAG: ABC transporter substrate-binding protein [Armatimonadota bacterium]|nr:ABC transporter substrate-binding protein [Armatimonadota bacterium]MDR7437175.1 ABC transporter substrate-binding protein [Armatimonadota bacterium]MDR7473224.1 ABC transporter substrate-binding protein [Armatimonadota bacterium]MDR7507382.1 ABC transporter substrate-binding protein [Armatimonadota bacterium]MDR7509679.1 ABC transporter substrate-binding protein [Armatimonadota bacterium]